MRYQSILYGVVDSITYDFNQKNNHKNEFGVSEVKVFRANRIKIV